jgi:hypothetical protein
MTNEIATFWDNTHENSNLAKAVSDLISLSGEVKKEYRGHKIAELERFRKMSNAYYDIFNNGGGNRGRAISRYFGTDILAIIRNLIDPPFWSSESRREAWNRIHSIVEPIINEQLLKAAEEQNINV